MRQAWADNIKNVTKCSKHFIDLEFGDYIWNQHKKCIQIGTQMPDNLCMDGETNGRVQII